MMPLTPDKRLDQLEPIIGEFAAQLDLHTAQLRRANTGIVMLIETTTNQSDNITFLLRGQLEHKERLAEIKTDIAELKTDVVELKADVAKINDRLDGIDNRLDGMSQTLTAILNAVQKPSGN